MSHDEVELYLHKLYTKKNGSFEKLKANSEEKITVNNNFTKIDHHK